MATLNIDNLQQVVQEWNTEPNKTPITDFSARDKTLLVWKKVYISIVEGKVGFVELNFFERVARILFWYHSDTILGKEKRNKVVEAVRKILNESVVERPLQKPIVPNTSNATNSSEGPIVELPNEMVEAIFQYSTLRDRQSIACVCKTWNGVVARLIQKKFVQEHAFGREMWKKYIGDVGVEPPLPLDIYKILMSPCPFNPGKRVYETHLLTLIPKTVNGKPFTLNSLGNLVQTPKEGFSNQYSDFGDEIKNEHGDTPVKASYWVLFTKDVIPGSRNRTYKVQKKLVKDLGTKAKVPYAVPEPLDAITSIFMHYVQTGTPLYSYKSKTYTRTQQKVSQHLHCRLFVGGLSSLGLDVSICHDYGIDESSGGMGGSRKFMAIDT